MEVITGPMTSLESFAVFAASFEDMSMTSPTWRALGQVVLVYFAVGGAAVNGAGHTAWSRNLC